MEAVPLRQDPFVLALYRRVAKGDTGWVQIFFEAAVLDRYREQGGYEIVRTDNAGRIKRPGSWSLDFGITGDESLIHLSVSDWVERVPENEREHWLSHLVHLPHSRPFVRIRMAPGSCFDDGAIRPW